MLPNEMRYLADGDPKEVVANAVDGEGDAKGGESAANAAKISALESKMSGLEAHVSLLMSAF